MFRIAVALFLLGPAFAQSTFRVILNDESISGNAKLLGKGKDLGLWSADVCNTGAVKDSLARQRMTMEGAEFAKLEKIPILRPIPNDMAVSLLTIKAQRDPHSVLGAVGDTLLSLSSATSTAIGIASKSKTAGYIGLGMSGAQMFLSMIKKNAPDPTRVISKLYPEEPPTLLPGQCGSWLLLTYRMPHVQPIGPFEVK